MLHVPSRLLRDDQERAPRGERPPGGVDEELGDPKIGVVGRVGKREIVGARLRHVARRLEGDGDVFQAVERGAALRALDCPGGAVEGVDMHRGIAGGDADGHAAGAAADIDNSQIGGNVDGIEQVPRAGIDPPVGKDAGTAHRLEQSVAVAKDELAGEVAQLGGRTGLLHDVGDRFRLGIGGRPHAHGLARLGQLLAEPLVAGIVDRRHEVAAAGEIDERRLQNVAGEFPLAFLGERHDGEVVGPRRHVGHARGSETGRLGGPGRDGQIVPVEIEKPGRHRGGGPFGGQGDRRLPAADGRAEHAFTGQRAGDLERMRLGRPGRERFGRGGRNVGQHAAEDTCPIRRSESDRVTRAYWAVPDDRRRRRGCHDHLGHRDHRGHLGRGRGQHRPQGHSGRADLAGRPDRQHRRGHHPGHSGLPASASHAVLRQTW